MDGELTCLKQGPGAITSYGGIDVWESDTTERLNWTELNCWQVDWLVTREINKGLWDP